jgi:hypothetical protein
MTLILKKQSKNVFEILIKIKKEAYRKIGV